MPDTAKQPAGSGASQQEAQTQKARGRTAIEIFDYNEREYKEYKFEGENYESLRPTAKDIVRWINIDGLNDMHTLEQICRPFEIHTLVREDILNTNLRAKVEDYGCYLYIIAKMAYFTDESLVHEQVSMILGDGYVISFGEKPGDVFDRIRERIRSEGAHIRKYGADYLAYLLLDAIVDGYFNVLEKLGDRIDEREEELINNPTMEYLHNIRLIKKDLLYMHKAIWPIREVAAWMEREGTPLIAESTQLYIRDVYSHIIQAIDTTETYRELLSGIMDTYLSSISNRMNEIMKVLTIISTIFIPLTFLAGVYGMNFKYMPELGWPWGYGAVILLMVAVAVSMVLYFKRKRWF